MRFRRQRGVALILALMVFAVISGVAVKVLSSVDRTMDIADFAQQNVAQKETLLGGEAWAVAWLRSSLLPDDLTQGIDWRYPWLLANQTFPLEGDDRQLEIQLIDRQSCININALVDEDTREVTLQRLRGLSNELSISDDWVNYVADWVDADQSWSANGSREDEYYLGMGVPYRTGDTPMVSMAEMALLGLDDEMLSTLAPYVCALPQDIGLNVNRLSLVMIRALFPDLNTDEQEQLKANIQTSGFDDIGNFLALESFEDLALVESDWRIDTRFIDAYITLTDQGKQRYLHSQLMMSDDGVVVPVTRSFMAFDVISESLLMEQETN